MKKTLVFTGTITAIQPISFIPPLQPKQEAGKLPRMGGSLYLTASGIRSAVRHAMVTLISDIQQKKLDLDDYFLMTLGGIKDANKETKKEAKKGTKKGVKAEAENGDDADDDADIDVSYISRARFAHERNPAIALFGSMRHGVPGAVFCSHAIAAQEVKPDTVRYVRANDFMRDPELADRLDENAIEKFIARQSASAKRTSSKDQIEALKKSLRTAKQAGDDDLFAQINEQIKENGDSGSEAVQLSLPNLAYECIPPGTELFHEFVLENVNDIEIALFVQSLNELALMPYLGGKKNHGLGRFAARWDVRIRDEGNRKMQQFGEIVIDGNFNELTATNGIAKYADRSILEDFLRDPKKADLSEKSLSAQSQSFKTT